MANRIHQLVLALALTGLAGGVLAQTGSDSPTAGADSSAPPGAPHAHSRQGGDWGQGGEHGKWGGEGRGDEHWGHGRHGHHHHHHHHRRHGCWGHGGHGHGPGMMGGRGLMGSFHELDLTPAQREQVHTILSTARQQHADKRQGAGGRPDMMALANPGDPNYATALQAAKKRAADRIQEFGDLQQKLYNVLTPQQKTQLTKTLAEHKAKMAQWKARMEQWKTERAQKSPQGAPANQ